MKYLLTVILKPSYWRVLGLIVVLNALLFWFLVSFEIKVHKVPIESANAVTHKAKPSTNFNAQWHDQSVTLYYEQSSNDEYALISISPEPFRISSSDALRITLKSHRNANELLMIGFRTNHASAGCEVPGIKSGIMWTYMHLISKPDSLITISIPSEKFNAYVFDPLNISCYRDKLSTFYPGSREVVSEIVLQPFGNMIRERRVLSVLSLEFVQKIPVSMAMAICLAVISALFMLAISLWWKAKGLRKQLQGAQVNGFTVSMSGRVRFMIQGKGETDMDVPEGAIAFFKVVYALTMASPDENGYFTAKAVREQYHATYQREIARETIRDYLRKADNMVQDWLSKKGLRAARLIERDSQRDHRFRLCIPQAIKSA